MSTTATGATPDAVPGFAAQTMSRETAQWLLSLRADDALQARADDLADKNTEGALTPEERAEYERIVYTAEVIALLQANARHVLSTSNAA